MCPWYPREHQPFSTGYYVTYSVKLIEYTVKGPITFFSDFHNHIQPVQQLLDTKPQNLFCLGDLVDMFDRQLNNNTLDYYRPLNIPTLRGNHDRVVSNSQSLTPINAIYLSDLPLGFKIYSDYGNIFAYHSCATSDDEFMEGNLSTDKIRRCFKLTPDIKYVFYGHVHKQFKMNYPVGPTLCCVGLMQEGKYATLDESGIHFKKI